jgi:hypothetical protein
MSAKKVRPPFASWKLPKLSSVPADIAAGLIVTVGASPGGKDGRAGNAGLRPDADWAVALRPAGKAARKAQRATSMVTVLPAATSPVGL